MKWWAWMLIGAGAALVFVRVWIWLAWRALDAVFFHGYRKQNRR